MTTPGNLPLKSKNITNKKHFDLDAVDLKIIYLISKEQNLGDVARQLGITIGAVSQRLRVMETKLEMTLAIRKPLKLTDAGELTLKFSQSVFQEYDQLLVGMAKLRSNDGMLKIIAISSLLIDDALPALKDTANEFIHLKTFQYEGHANEIVDAVKKGIADVGLIGIKLSIPGLIFETYKLSKCVFLMEKDHPLFKLKKMKLIDAADYAMPDLPSTNLLSQRLNTAQLVDKVFIKSSYQAPTVEIAAHYAATTKNGICVTLDSVAHRFAKSHGAHIAVIDEPWAVFEMFTVTREIELRSSAMTYFINKLRTRYRIT